MVMVPRPGKSFYKIGEAAQLVGVSPHVLRYWESEFPNVSPMKTRGAHRMYRPADIAALIQIKHLIHEQGFTISGARKQLMLAASPRSAAGPKETLLRSPGSATQANAAGQASAGSQWGAGGLPVNTLRKRHTAPGPDGGVQGALSLDTVSPDPVSPDPVSPGPVSPDPVSPDPVSPDPVSPDPVSPSLVSLHPFARDASTHPRVLPQGRGDAFRANEPEEGAAPSSAPALSLHAGLAEPGAMLGDNAWHESVERRGADKETSATLASRQGTLRALQEPLELSPPETKHLLSAPRSLLDVLTYARAYQRSRDHDQGNRSGIGDAVQTTGQRFQRTPPRGHEVTCSDEVHVRATESGGEANAQAAGCQSGAGLGAAVEPAVMALSDGRCASWASREGVPSGAQSMSAALREATLTMELHRLRESLRLFLRSLDKTAVSTTRGSVSSDMVASAADMPKGRVEKADTVGAPARGLRPGSSAKSW